MKKYQMIVFDMDGTLYNLDGIASGNYHMQCDFLMNKEGMSKDEVVSLFTANHIYPEMKEDSKSCTEFFEQRGISRKEWNRYREENFDEGLILKEKAASKSVLDAFAKDYVLVLLTSNSEKNVDRILNHIGIQKTCFKEIICSDFNKIDARFDKKKAFRYILDSYKVRPDEVLSIGDRFETDVKPLLTLGGDGIRIKEPTALKKIADDLSLGRLSSCEHYRFWGAEKAY